MRGLDRDSGQWTDKTLERGKVIRLKKIIERSPGYGEAVARPCIMEEGI